MRILVVSPYVPSPPVNGGRMRIWAELLHFSRNHEVSLAALVEPGEEEPPPALREVCTHLRLARRGPLFPDQDERLPPPVLQFRSRYMIEALRELGRRPYDIVMLEHLFSAPYAPLFPNSAVVLCEHNIESLIYRRSAAITSEIPSIAQAPWVTRATGIDLAAYENRVWPTFPLRTVVSDEDDREMRRRCATGRSVVVPNGVDLDAYAPLPTQRGPVPSILFMGSLDYPPNIDAAFRLVEDILPCLRRDGLEVTAVIAGRRPVPEVVRLGELPGVQVIADPPDMAPIAERCGVCVVPLRSGSGTRLKILHAFALGRPVVSTSLGAEGLDLEDGRELLIRDQPAEMAAAVRQLLESRDLCDRLRAKGFEAAQRYSWSNTLVPLEDALCEEADRFSHDSRKSVRSR